MDLLGSELTLDQKLLLDGMSRHPGFLIFKKLMEESLLIATNKVIALDPTSERYAEKLQALQHEARALRTFIQSLINSTAAHAEGAEAEIQSQKEWEKVQKGLLVSQSNKD